MWKGIFNITIFKKYGCIQKPPNTYTISLQFDLSFLANFLNNPVGVASSFFDTSNMMVGFDLDLLLPSSSRPGGILANSISVFLDPKFMLFFSRSNYSRSAYYCCWSSKSDLVEKDKIISFFLYYVGMSMDRVEWIQNEKVSSIGEIQVVIQIVCGSLKIDDRTPVSKAPKVRKVFIKHISRYLMLGNGLGLSRDPSDQPDREKLILSRNNFVNLVILITSQTKYNLFSFQLVVGIKRREEEEEHPTKGGS